MDYGAAGITKNYIDKNHFFPVRLLNTSPLMDLDANVYTTVIINSQEWTVQNWRCTKYANGNPITYIPLAANWAADSLGGYCYPNGDIVNLPDYGRLYNHFAVAKASGFCYLERGGVQEPGWRVATRIDYTNLATFLGGTGIAGTPLREVGITHWDAPSTGTDIYGFAIRGAGWRTLAGGYSDFRIRASIWTSTSVDAWSSFRRYTDNSSGWFQEDALGIDKNTGFSVRMVRDI
jgi:uncharacterized protein (TIGR02145 family)